MYTSGRLILSTSRGDKYLTPDKQKVYKSAHMRLKQAPPQRPKEDNQLTLEKRKEIEAAYARRDIEFLRQCFAGSNQGASECAERYLERLLEEIRSERDRSDAFFQKKSFSVSGEPDPEQSDTETKQEP